MIKARASGSKVYLYFMKKGRQARHRIPRNSCKSHIINGPINKLYISNCLHHLEPWYIMTAKIKISQYVILIVPQKLIPQILSWLVVLGFNGPLRQYFSLYRAVSQREGERGKKDR